MTCSTRERKLVERAQHSTTKPGKSQKKSFHIFVGVLLTFVLQAIVVGVLYTQYGVLLSHDQKIRVGQDEAVDSIICVLRLPQVQRTDENVTACLEPPDDA